MFLSSKRVGGAIGGVVLAVALLSAQTSYGQPQEQPQTAQRAQDSRDKQNEAPPPPTSLQGEGDVEQTQASDDGAAAREQREEWDLKAQWVAAIAASVSALFGLLGLIGLFFTVKYARKVWEADRAWLTSTLPGLNVTQNTIINDTHNSEALTFWANWQNTGRSPAILRTVFVDFRVIGIDENVPTLGSGHDETEPRERAAVGPGQPASSAINAVGEAELMRLRAQQAKLIIYSFVAYEIVTGLKSMRISDAMFEVIINGKVTTPEGLTRDNFQVRSLASASVT